MVDGLIKSPCKYFDVTPSADLNTRFSNDLGNMEDLLLDVLSDSIEGPLVSLILLANVFSVGLYYLAPGVISIIVIVYLFLYSK
jgi:ABC-type multidrug transport system fused ATPase/permease subunit